MEKLQTPSGVRSKTIHKLVIHAFQLVLIMRAATMWLSAMSSLVQVLFNSLLIWIEIHGPSGYCVFSTTLSLQEHSASFTQEDLCTHQANC